MKRAPGLDNELGAAYMRGDVVVHVIDCKRLTHPLAHKIYDELAASDRLGDFTRASVIELAHRFALSLHEARILWGMIHARPASWPVMGVDHAHDPA